MSLRGKLLLALAPLGLALVVVGAVAVRSVSRLGGQTQLILKDNYQSVLAAQRMKESVERIDSAALFLLAGHRKKARAQLENQRPAFEKQLEVQEGNITEAGEDAATRRLRKAWTDYQRELEAFLALDDDGRLKQTYFDRLEGAFIAVKNSADAILTLNQDAMHRKSKEAHDLAKNTSAAMLATAAAALLAGVVISTLFTRRLLRPLGVLTQAVERLGEGDFQARANIVGRDEIALLAQRFNTMADHLLEYRGSSLGELLLAQRAAQAAIDSIPDPTLIYTADRAVLNRNHAAEALYAHGGGQVTGELAPEVAPRLQPVLQRVVEHVLQGKGAYVPKSFDEAVSLVLGDGERCLLPRATPVYEASGRVSGVTVILQDVTRLRRFDELKNDLVATVAHEFRTPLTSLRMAVHLCAEGAAGEVNEKQADLLHAAREDCARLQTIVDELLDLARIQSGRIEVDRRPTRAAELIAAAIQAERPAAERRGVRLEDDTFDDAGEVLADPDRSRLVLSNLLTNAIRHSPTGSLVTVRARPDGNALRFEVRDGGSGIAKEYQQAIFEKFFRLPGVNSGGAGLGLFIAKEIVEAHGGRIGVESTPGQGSTFWFTLPKVEMTV
ncbi:MAG TPA: ATP-binding protein [Pirellulales bacterium]|nr:ATP-binding protein [Pirellulales bacterium]